MRLLRSAFVLATLVSSLTIEHAWAADISLDKNISTVDVLSEASVSMARPTVVGAAEQTLRGIVLHVDHQLAVIQVGESPLTIETAAGIDLVPGMDVEMEGTPRNSLPLLASTVRFLHDAAKPVADRF